MVFINTEHHWAKTVSILLYQKKMGGCFWLRTFILMSFQSDRFFLLPGTTLHTGIKRPKKSKQGGKKISKRSKLV